MFKLILRIHDQQPEGVSLLGTIISTLGYADDLGLLNYGDVEGLKKTSERIISIAIGSRTDTDMVVSLSKTKVLQYTSGTKTPRPNNRNNYNLFKIIVLPKQYHNASLIVRT